MGPMPGLSQNWSVPFSPRAALCCAMDSSTGPEPITSSNHLRNLGFTSTELPNEQWRRWASQRAWSSLSTEHVEFGMDGILYRMSYRGLYAARRNVGDQLSPKLKQPKQGAG